MALLSQGEQIVRVVLYTPTTTSMALLSQEERTMALLSQAMETATKVALANPVTTSMALLFQEEQTMALLSQTRMARMPPTAAMITSLALLSQEE